MSFQSLFGGALNSKVGELFKTKQEVSKDDLRKRRTEIVIERKEEYPEESEHEEQNESGESVADESEKSDDESDEESDKPVPTMDDEDLESRYYENLHKRRKVEKETETETEEKKETEREEKKETETETETDKTANVGTPATLVAGEESLEQAARTVFLGNVASGAITDKATYKSLKKLLSAYGKVESIRFRSIAFDEPVPRKVAFARKSLHSSRESCNAYVVFKEKDASRKAVALNGTVFADLHLRVDHVAHPSPRDNKRTVFVGNLDFEEKEETLWRYFNEHTGGDVEAVRVVRDPKTNVGKGFAMVQFKDSISVNKALLLHDKPMVAKGRKVRITRAKSYAKPSILSPNHVDNQKKKKTNGLNDKQKTRLGRAQSVLGKADRANLEGIRATKGAKIAGIKGLKSAKGRVKKPRLRERSQKFKEERDNIKKELEKGEKKGKKEGKEKKDRNGKEKKDRNGKEKKGKDVKKDKKEQNRGEKRDRKGNKKERK